MPLGDKLEDYLPVAEDELDQYTPVAPNVSELATLRRASIEKQSIPETTGPGDAGVGAAIDYGYGQESHTAQRGRATMEATRRFMDAGSEFLKAPAHWAMETASRPTEDTPLTAMIGAAIEIASYTAAPVEEVFVQGTRLAGELAGLDQEQIKELEERASMTAGTIAGMISAAPHLKATQAKMLGQEAWMKSEAAQQGVARQVAEKRIVSEAFYEGTYKPTRGEPLQPMGMGAPEEPLPPGFFPPEAAAAAEGGQTMAQAARTSGGSIAARAQAARAAIAADKAEAQAAPVKAAVTTQAPAVPVKGPAPGAAATATLIPEATVEPRQNQGAWATLNVRQGYTGAGFEPVRVAEVNGRPSLMMADNSKLAEMTVEEAKAYRQAEQPGAQAAILDDVAARVMAEMDNPAAKDSLDFPPITDEELDAIERVTLAHGSPHLFEKFSLEKIGTGEGAQAYTHGLYFAESEGVARTYMRAGGQGETILDGVDINEVRVDMLTRQHVSAIERDAVLELSDMGGLKIDDLVRDLRRKGAEPSLYADLHGPEEAASYKKWQEQTTAIADQIEKWQKEGRIKQAPGHIYKTEIPKAVMADFLDLDLPFDQQPEKVRRAFSALGVESKVPDLLNEKLIETLEAQLEDNKSKIRALNQDRLHGELSEDQLAFNMDQQAVLIDQNEQIRVKLRNQQQIFTAQDAYYALASKMGEEKQFGNIATGETWMVNVPDEAAASRALSELGVKGAKYLDQGSRGAGEGTRNYVLYDDSIINITEIDGKPVKGKKAVNEPDLKAQLDARREALEPPDMNRVIDQEILAERGHLAEDLSLVDEERLAIEDEGQTSIQDDIARELGVDPVSGLPLPTAEEVAADASRAAQKAKKPRKGKGKGAVLPPSVEAFRETYGGTSVGSGAAAAKRTAVARAKYQRIFEQGPADGYTRLYQVDGQTYTDAFEQAARTDVKGGMSEVRWTDVPDAKAAKYLKDGKYTVPKTTADRSRPASVPRGTPVPLEEVEVGGAHPPVVEEMRPAEPAPVPRGEGPPVVPGARQVPTGNVLDALGMGEETPPESRGPVPEAAPAMAPEVAAGFEAQRRAAAQPGQGVVLPIRKTSVSEYIMQMDYVTDEAGVKWQVEEPMTPEGMVKVSRVTEFNKDGSIKTREDGLFHRDELTTELPIYDPVKGASAIRLKDGTVVVGTRYTHNSAGTEARQAGLGHLISNEAQDFGGVIGEDQRFLTMDEWEQYKSANRKAEAEAGGAVDVVGTPGVAPRKKGIFGSETGALTLPARKTAEQKVFALLKSQVKGLRSIIGDHGLKFTQWAAPHALDAINHALGARGGSKFYIAKHLTQAIDRVLGPGAHEKILAALRDSNIQGAKDRWTAYADMLGEMTDAEVLEMADNWGRDWFGLAVDHINEKNAPLMKGALTRNINQGNAANVRSMLKTVYERAAKAIPEMPEGTAKFIQTEEFWKGIEAAAPFFEDLKNWNAEVGGHETHFTGPAGVYIPLTPFEASMEARPFGGLRRPFRRIKPGTTMHRTGLSGQYDASVEALSRRVSANIRAIGRNEAVASLNESGVGKLLAPGQKAPEQMFAVAGVPEEVVVFETTKERLFVDDKGKIQKVPPQRLALPKSIADELRPVFEGNINDYEAFERLQNGLIKTFLRGIAEPAIHGQNVVSFLGKATGEFFPQAAIRVFRTDMNSPAAIRQLQWMAEHGALPNRYGSVSFAKELAAQFGGEHLQPLKPGKSFLDFSASLYGPEGIDIKARVAAALYFDDMVEAGHFKNVTAADKFRFLDQLGHYQAQSRTAFQKATMKPYLQPFFTAATTRMRAALEIWGLAEKSVPLQGWDLAKLRIRQHMTQGVVGGTMAWIAAHRVATGKWPWEDRNAKLWQVPVPREWAKSAVGKVFIKDEPGKQPYIGIGGLFPVGYTMLRLTGAQNAINTAIRGGNAAQMREAAASQAIATVLQQAIGPAMHVVFGAVPEVSPDILRFGRRGSGPLTFASQDKEQKPGPGLDVLERGKAGAREVGQIGEVVVEALELGMSSGKEVQKRGVETLQKIPKNLANLLLKQLLASSEDVAKTRERLRKERAGKH